MPFLALALTVVVYLVHLPYAVYRYRWLARHPEAWYVAARQRRAAVRNSRPLGVRPQGALSGRGAARRRHDDERSKSEQQ